MFDHLESHCAEILRSDPDAHPSVRLGFGGIGLRFTVRHYYDFKADRTIVGNDLGTPDSWDRLRTQTVGAFAIPATRDAFIASARAHAEIANRARAVDMWLTDRGAASVASYGVGSGVLEWWMRELRPGREIACTDYAAATVERLNEIVPELSARRHDLRQDGPLHADVHLFHRIDTELDDRQWREVFERFSSVPILLVAATILDVKTLTLELLARPRLWRRKASRAGFLRTRAAFASLWPQTHFAQPLRIHDHDAWYLMPRAEPIRRGGVGG